MIEIITQIADPRLADYRNLTDAALRADAGLFVAESEMVVRRLLGSAAEVQVEVRSLMVTAPRLAALEQAGMVPPAVPVYLVPQEVMDGVTGLHVHRGCLAVGVRPAAAVVPADARVVVALEDLVDVDNLGSLVRSAVAFGADAILLSPRCADPFYRKAIRTSVGTVFSKPIVRATAWPAALVELRRRGFTVVGAVADAAARPLHTLAPPPRVVMVLGSEGPGLCPGARAACDELVTIPMAAGADSLNVAVAGAICLYEVLGRHGTRA